MSPHLHGLIKGLLCCRVYTLPAVRWRMSFRAGAVLSSSLCRQNTSLEKRRGLCEFELQPGAENPQTRKFLGALLLWEIFLYIFLRTCHPFPSATGGWDTSCYGNHSFWEFLLTSVAFPPPQHTCWVFANLLSLSKGTPGPWAGNPDEVS